MRNRMRHAGILAFVLALAIAGTTSAMACSEIFVGGEHPVSARTFDFMFGEGEAVKSPRGVTRTTNFVKPDETALAWTSTYGSVVFNVAMPLPGERQTMTGVDGMNEAGLKVGTYYLPESVMPKGSGGTVLCITSLIQYALDRFATIDELTADLRSGAYRVTALPTTRLELMLHLFVHDATGASAIIEFLDGNIVVTPATDIPVLTNTPYAQSVRDLAAFEDFGGKRPIPGGQEPMDRFVRGAYYAKHLPKAETRAEAVDFATAALQTLTVPPVFEHGCTLWDIVTDMKGKTVYVRTLHNRKLSWISFDALDFSEGGSVKTLDFQNGELSGDISSKFRAR
ncbi:choloylglycine hydrolase [Desulfobaculum xiamenense]|uniref:Choloylglycine hydrolase n=1 Tax=Desulfobaculum xiamenense TaxID=995050 RepID=A0A846QLT7_9BACT|nr:linear amide C-N hydrolase [Desulfobaculum xiamenense]NJB67173.1 choloylglycine hydrolase [Desulfobaculum xiamenense]